MNEFPATGPFFSSRDISYLIRGADSYWSLGNDLNLGSSETVFTDFDDTLFVDGGIVAVGGSLHVGAGNQFFVQTGFVSILDGSLNVSDATHIGSGGSVVLDGGSLTTKYINRFDEGQFSFNSGVLTLTDSVNAFFKIDPNTSETFSSSQQLHNRGTTFVNDFAELIVNDSGSFSSGKIVNNGTISLGGDTVLGDLNRHDAYSGSGQLHVGTSHSEIRDAGFAELGQLTTIAGGGLTVNNGLTQQSGSVLTGFGVVEGKIAGALGSQIIADGGNLTLGDHLSVVGFVSQGELYTQEYSVTIHDANQAQLGNLTEVGRIESPTGEVAGSLIIDNGAIIDFGDNLIGYGTVDSINDVSKSIVNNGLIAGKSETEQITLTGYVKGVGTFDNVIFTGTFDPGHSPAELHVGNLEFSDNNLLNMEIGGRFRGDEYDTLISTGLLSLDGDLQVSLLNGFNPRDGDWFDLFDWQTIEGQFDNYLLPSLGAGLRWDTSQLNFDGSLLVTAIPEPGTTVLFTIVLAAISFNRRRWSSVNSGKQFPVSKPS